MRLHDRTGTQQHIAAQYAEERDSYLFQGL